jgi:hypothetical protein
MGGSTADTPTTPDFLRVSDAERDHAVDELRSEFVDGRLSHETFVYRMQTALVARNQGQLAGLFADLPPRRIRMLARIKTVLRGTSWTQGPQPDPTSLRRDNIQTAWFRDPSGPGAPSGPGGPGGPGSGPGSYGRPAPGGSAGPGQVSGYDRPAPLVFPPGSRSRFTIGRTRDCDLCLPDLSVSRLHAELVRGPDGWLLNDLGSHNGTRLNGWLVRETVQIRPGDRVEFGSTSFVIQSDPQDPE